MKIIAGLGNPGARYVNTRHNAGFAAVDCLARRLGVGFTREKYDGVIAEVQVEGERILLLKPMTYMNLSGRSVAKACRNRIEDYTSLLVVTDDVNLDFGTLRFRREGSAGGHNGLKSIIECLGAQTFPRLRMGVGTGEPDQGLTQHVLGRFRPEEREAADALIERAADAMTCWITEGIDKAMDKFN